LYNLLLIMLYKIIIFVEINTKIMGRRKKITSKEIIETINNTAPKIIFYTDKISIRLKNLNSIDFWKEKFPNGKIRYC